MLNRLRTTPATQKTSLVPQGAPNIRVTLRPNKRARRLTLRVSAKTGQTILTHPYRYPLEKLQSFVDEKSVWIVKHQHKSREFSFGETVEILGKSYLLAKNTTNRSRIVGPILYLPTTNSETPRLSPFLKTQALDFVETRIDHYAAQIHRTPDKIRLRDTKSRWGSCSSKGDIMLSWRLALAPLEVFDYVIAHEVAHLKHMDHSEKFWETVAQIFPTYKAERSWLRENGQDLLRITLS